MSKKNRSPWKSQPAAQSLSSVAPAATLQNPARPAHEAPASMCQRGDSPGFSSVSPAQLLANQANAQLSTGPRTSAGRAKSSLNALKSGLTGETILLPTDDAIEYERHLNNYVRDLSPEGEVETDRVILLAQTAWRLKRVPSLETSIYALGEIELADAFPDYEDNPELRASLVRAAVHLKYEKQIRNLHLQESRLQRRFDKALHELIDIQFKRSQAAQPANQQQNDDEFEEISAAEHERQFLYGGPYMDKLNARIAEKEKRAAENGFEFSNRANGAAETSNSVKEAA